MTCYVYDEDEDNEDGEDGDGDGDENEHEHKYKDKNNEEERSEGNDWDNYEGMNERMLPAISRASLLAKEGPEMRRIDVVNHLLWIILRRRRYSFRFRMRRRLCV
mgnify:CR=1 FL=1